MGMNGRVTSLHNYRQSLEISGRDPSFYSLLFSLLRKADSANYGRLVEAFPQAAAEFQARYNAPGGALPGEEAEFQRYLDSLRAGR